MAGDSLSSLGNNANVYPINSADAAITVYTPVSGQFFMVLDLFIQAADVTALTLKSGTIPISGPIAFIANAERHFTNAPFPIFVGRDVGQAFIIANGASKQLNGYALIVGGS